MSRLQKGLKVVCIITIVLAVIALAEGVTYLAGIEVPGMEVPAGSSPLVLGVLALINGVLYLVVGALGARWANEPAKLKPFLILAAIGLALAIIIGIYDVVSGGFDLVVIVPPIMHIVFMTICLVLGNAVVKEARA